MKKLLAMLVSLILVFFMATTPSARASDDPEVKDMLKYGVPSIDYSKDTESPSWIRGNLSEKLTNDFNGVIKFFNNNKEIFNIESAADEFKLVKDKNDELGFRHIRVQQVVGGIPVFGNEYYVHFDNEGKVYAVNGRFDPAARKYKVDKALIREKDAEEIAKSGVNYDKLEMPIVTTLYLYRTESAYLPVYEVRINFLSPEPGDWLIYVNAYDGSIVNMYNNLKTAKPGGGTPTTGTAAIGTGTGVLGDAKTFNILLSSGTYYMVDISKPMYSKGGIIATYDANNQTRLPGTIMSSSSTAFTGTRHPAGVDAQYYAGKVYEYYYSQFGRNSLDNAGMSIKSSVHYSRSYNNAFWNGSQMVYGDGDGVNYRAFSAAFDVVGHEMTHGVTDKEAGLIYEDQSGALSESLSDLFACFMENKNWIMGEDCCITSVGFRSVEDPSLFGDPETMDEYVVTTQDNGGVHTNCGIPNRAGYLIAASIGNDKAGKIYYRAVVNYMTSSTDFSQARAELLQSAADLYGTNSTEYNAVKSGFDSVGIY